MLVIRILEAVLVVLAVRAILAGLLRMTKKKPEAGRKTAERFDARGKDIIDGEFKDLP